MKQILLILLLTAFSTTIASAQQMSFTTTLPSFKLSNKEAFFLYTKLLNKREHLLTLNKSYNKSLASINSQLEQANLLLPNLNSNIQYNNLIEKKIKILEAQNQINKDFEFIDNQLRFIINYNPTLHFEVYNISDFYIIEPYTSLYPSIKTPLIDSYSDLKLNPTLNLALPVVY